MSKLSPDSDSDPDYDTYDLIGIVKNPDGSITRNPTRLPCVPATPDPSPLNPVVSKDITVNPSKPTWMRLYVPTTALNDNASTSTRNAAVSSKQLPLVVYYHGGGFITYSVDCKPVHDLCNRMARDLNVVVASSSYRLAPEHRLPAAYDDGVEAIEWIRNSDDVWIKSHADRSNVYLMGSSAGGNLAYNVGLRAAFADMSPLRIRGLILHHPFFGGEMRSGSEIIHEDDEFFPSDVGDLCWELCLPVGANRDHKYSNPTVGGGEHNLRKIKRLGWKVMVSGRRGGPMIDRQRDVANLFKEKGVEVVELFTDNDNLQTLFGSIRNFISSPALFTDFIKYLL